MSFSLVLHLVAIVLAALALWSMRHELSERATTRLKWTLPVLFALATAAVLLIVSPGKRPELWLLCIGGGFVVGLGGGMVQRPIKDFSRHLVLVHRTWDGVGAAALLLLLAVTRFVTTDLMGRESHGFGVLGGLAMFLAVYLAGRLVSLQLYTARKSIHLDMVEGEKRHGGG
jgi:hypothetical protein